MELKAIKTAQARGVGDISKFVLKSLRNAEKSFKKHSLAEIFDGSVIVISSKIVSILEGNSVSLGDISFENLVRKEADEVIREVKCSLDDSQNGCFLTLKNGILIPNAGVDRSNMPEGYAIPWPKKPEESAEIIRNELLKNFGVENLGVIIMDSRVTQGRRGTTGVALAWSGFIGVADERGTLDLFGKPLQITQRAVADNLATAALCLMGEAAECTPIVVIQNAPVTFSDESADAATAIITKKADLF